MIANPHPQIMTIEQYFEWEPLQDFRYEYHNIESILQSQSQKS